MKLMKQLAVILLMTFFGELLNHIVPLPIPAAIWGMMLLFIALVTGIVKLDMVETTADYLTSLMILIFVPFGASIMVSYTDIKDYLVQIMLIITVSFFVVFFVTGKTSDFIIDMKEKKAGRGLQKGAEEVSHE